MYIINLPLFNFTYALRLSVFPIAQGFGFSEKVYV